MTAMEALTHAQMTNAIRERWPRMPVADVDIVINEVEKEAEARGVSVTGAMSKRSYLSFQAEGLPHNLAYVHLGYVSIRDDGAVENYRTVPLTYFEFHSRDTVHVSQVERSCQNCFIRLPTGNTTCDFCGEDN